MIASPQVADTTKAGQPNSYNLEMLPSLNVYLLGRRISCMTVAAIVEAIHTACVEGRKITVANYNVHSFNLSMQLPWFYDFLQSAEIAHCDSSGILKALQYMGLNLPIQYRASYTLLMPKLLEHCNQEGFSVFLLGSKPQCVEAAIARLQRHYPNVSLAGYHGYFDKEDPEQNAAVIQKINRAKPHLLVVGMGMPLQENWIRLNRPYLDVNVILPGGAIIDRLAGVVPDCPAFISNVGFEWLYRLLREPKRLAARYLIGNPAFLLHIAFAKFCDSSSSLHVEEMQPTSNASMEAEDNLGNLLSPSRPQKSFSATDLTDAKYLSSYLLEAGLLTPAQVETALSEQKATGRRFGDVLVYKGWIRQKTIDYLMKNVILRDRPSLVKHFSLQT